MSCGLVPGVLYCKTNLVKFGYHHVGTSSNALLLNQLKQWRASVLCNILFQIIEGHFKWIMTALLLSLNGYHKQ